MDSSFDPFNHLLVDSRIPTQVNAAQSLRFPKQRCNVFDGRTDQTTPFKIQMDQKDVILHEILEARDHFKIEASQLNVCLAIDNLLSRQFGLLLLKQDVVCE